MTKAELLKHLVSSEDIEAIVVDLVAYIKQHRSAIDSAISTANGKITTLIGSDTGKSARTIAAEEIAAQLIPASAQEALDTLQEIAAWIQSHPGDAAAMNTAIGNLQTLVGELPQDTTATTVVGYITAEIAALSSQIGGMSWKTINGEAITGSGNIVLPAEIEADPENLTSAQLEALKIGDVVIKTSGTEKHAYKVAYKDDTKKEIALVYADVHNVEEIYYEQDGSGNWKQALKENTNIEGGLHYADFETIGVTAAKAIVAAAIAEPEEAGE